jgi:hypothetical protein
MRFTQCKKKLLLQSKIYTKQIIPQASKAVNFSTVNKIVPFQCSASKSNDLVCVPRKKRYGNILLVSGGFKCDNSFVLRGRRKARTRFMFDHSQAL